MKEKVFTPTNPAITRLVGLIHQVGTGTPDITILQNTYKNAAPLITQRLGVGVYRISAANSIFTNTSVITSTIETKSNLKSVTIRNVTGFAFEIEQIDNTGSPVDGLDADTCWTISTFNEINQNQ